MSAHGDYLALLEAHSKHLSAADRAVYLWAAQYWPDVPQTWDEYCDYYTREWCKAHRSAA